MFCQYCKNEAKLNCQCSSILCGDHVKTHKKTCKLSQIRKIKDEDKLKFFSIELTKKINKIDEIIYEIVRKTKK